jgi:hypothetical protein
MLYYISEEESAEKVWEGREMSTAAECPEHVVQGICSRMLPDAVPLYYNSERESGRRSCAGVMDGRGMDDAAEGLEHVVQ